MTETMERKRTGLSLWMLLLAMGAAIVIACGFAKPAWGAAATVNDYASLQQVVSTTGGDIVLGQDINASSSSSSSNLEIKTSCTIDLNNHTLNMGNSEQQQIFVTCPSLTITGPGTITGSSTTGNVMTVGRTSDGKTYSASTVTIGSGVTFSNTAGSDPKGGRVMFIIGQSTVTLQQGSTVVGSSQSAPDSDSGGFPAIQVGRDADGTLNQNQATLIVNGSVNGTYEGKTHGTAITIIGNSSCTIGSTGVISGGFDYGTISSPAIRVGTNNPQGTSGTGLSAGTLTVQSGGQVIGLDGAMAISVQGSTDTVTSMCTVDAGATVKVEGNANDLSSPAISVGNGNPNIDTYTKGSAVINGNVSCENGSAVSVQGGACTIGEGANIIGGGSTDSESAPAVEVGYLYPGAPDDTAVSGTLDVTGGTITSAVDGINAIDNTQNSQTTIGGNALINGDVENVGAGKTTINGGTITGTVANNGTGTTEYVAGTVEGGFEGNITEPAPNPGDPQAIQTAVSGVVTPVTEAMAPYADVTVSADAYTWTVETTNGETPIASVANDLVAPIVSALNAAGSPSATSIQNPAVTITLAGSTLASQQSFALDVLENAVAIAPATLGPDATLSDLKGMTASISAETTSNALTYTFIFEGESPTPPVNEVAIYRLYNPYEEYHLYTKDVEEYEFLSTHGWNDEGIYWYAPAEAYEGTYTIIRLYNPYNGDHYYVMETDAEQIDFLTDAGWVPDNEEASFLSAPVDGPYPVYTLFNPFSQVNTHVYTPHEAEVATLEAAGMQENTTIIWAENLPVTAE